MRQNRMSLGRILQVAILGAAVVGLAGCPSDTPSGGGCKDNAACSGNAAGSICDVATGKCVVCTQDSNCTAGQKCDATKNKCVECIQNSHCKPGTVCRDSVCRQGCDTKDNCPTGQVCVVTAGGGICAQCGANADCASVTDKPKCDVNTRTCVGCVVDRDCDAGKVCKANECVAGCTTDQPCPTGKVCSQGACVECVVDTDCKQQGLTRCDARANKCVECLPGNDNCPVGKYCQGMACADGCRSDADCASQPNAKKCMVSKNVCVGCLANTDCAAGTVCDLQNNSCVAGCKNNDDCLVGNPPPAASGKKVCLVAKTTCVVCVSNADCPLGNICDVVTNTCNAGCDSDSRCEAGQSCCSGKCVVTTSNDNCGACGNKCDQSSACCNKTCTRIDNANNCGACGVTCTGGKTCCGTACADLQGEEANCGKCGNACAQGQVCCGGQCRSANPGETGACLDCSKPCLDITVNKDGFGSNATTTLTPGVTADNNNGLKTSAWDPQNQFSHVYVACWNSYNYSGAPGNGTVNKIDAKTGTIAGTFNSGGRDPSRGAQAMDGSFWIGNRGFGSPGDPAFSNVTQVKPDGTIGCTVGKAADGASLPIVRALAIDAFGFIWAGTWNDGRVHKIDPLQCKTVLDITLPGFSPYGFAVDSKGKMWVSSLSPNIALIDTNTGKLEWNGVVASTTYGVVVDRKDNAYFAQWGACSGGLFRADAAGSHAASIIPGTPGNGNCTRGLAIDANGDIWAAESSNPAYVSKFSGDGTGKFLARYGFAGVVNDVGIAADPLGKVWVTGLESHNYVRFDAATGQADTGYPKALNAGGANCTYPYNYSDWNGYSLRSITTKSGQGGSWNRIFDSGKATATWQSAKLSATVPVGSSVRVRFRAGATSQALGTAPWCGPFATPTIDLTTCAFGQKQLLEAQILMTTNDATVVPVVSQLIVYYQ